MKIAVLSIPAIVGHNPRTTSGLRDALQICPEDWYLADPYAGVVKSWWYPASVALPLPGVTMRRKRFVNEIMKDAVVENLNTQLRFIRQNGYEAVVAVGWSLGGWFALSSFKHLDGAILISPMLACGQLEQVHQDLVPDKPLLMVVGDADRDVPDAATMCKEWLKRERTDLFVIEGAQHPFDQPLLKDGGKLRNPLYSPNHEHTANLAVSGFVKRHF